MTLPIEKRLRLLGDVSNLLLTGSIQVYGLQKIRLQMPKIKSAPQHKRAA